LTALAYILSWIAQIITWATFVVAGLFLLRMIFAWAKVNPFARIPYHLTRLTERVVQPIRQQLGGRYMRFDFVPLIAAIIILFTGLFIANSIGELAGLLNLTDRALQVNQLSVRFLLGILIMLAGLLYGVLIFLRILLPYFGIGYSNSFMRFAYKFTEPLLRPLRRYLTFGMVDFSAWIALILVQFVTRILAAIVMGR
jgi:uncharacterized protein YggT (Ycf19 family)